jgi:hypothetical protein
MPTEDVIPETTAEAAPKLTSPSRMIQPRITFELLEIDDLYETHWECVMTPVVSKGARTVPKVGAFHTWSFGSGKTIDLNENL